MNASNMPSAPQITPEMQALLAQLHDIQTPLPVNFWPLAWGWWLLIAVALASLILGVVKIRRHKTRNAYRRQALREFKHCQNLVDDIWLLNMRALIKRVALCAYPHHAAFIKHAQGEVWREWLNQRGKMAYFSAELAPILGDGLYRPDVQTLVTRDREQLTQSIRLWIQHHHAKDSSHA